MQQGRLRPSRRAFEELLAGNERLQREKETAERRERAEEARENALLEEIVKYVISRLNRLPSFLLEPSSSSP